MKRTTSREASWAEKSRKRKAIMMALYAAKDGKRHMQPGARVISMKKAAPDGNQGAAHVK